MIKAKLNRQHEIFIKKITAVNKKIYIEKRSGIVDSRAFCLIDTKRIDFRLLWMVLDPRIINTDIDTLKKKSDYLNKQALLEDNLN